MPNWCAGTLRVRGTKENLTKFVLEGLQPVTYFGSEKETLKIDDCRVLGSVEDDDVLAYVIALGLHMGFSLEKIYKEYIRKNEINKERLAKGY